MAITLKDQIEMVLDHPAIQGKFKKIEQDKMDICNACPDTKDCWSCGASEPRKWW